MGLARWLNRWRSTGEPAAPNPAAAHPTDLDRRMMDAALELAREAGAIGEVPVGAVVYRLDTGQVLGHGHNRREIDRDPSAHAEFIAMLGAARAIGDWRLSDCGLAVTLEPCPMCAGLIVNARVRRVVYGATDPKAGAVDTLFRLVSDPRLNHRAEVVGGLRAEASAEQLREFFRTLRRSRRESSAGDVAPGESPGRGPRET